MVYQIVEDELSRREDYVLRRLKGIPNNRRLFVLACMDERLPVEPALGLREGDAHIFRNAGGLVTDDAIRSAALTTQFFQTREIIVLNHTDCGMIRFDPEEAAKILRDRVGRELDELILDPSLRELKLERGYFARWLRGFKDVDQICEAQVQMLKEHPLIPDDVEVHGYIYEVETGRLRRPYRILADLVRSR